MRTSLFVLTAMVIAVACGETTEKSVVHDPYDATFLRHRSGKDRSEIRSTTGRDIVDAFVAGSASMSIFPAVLRDGEDAVVSFNVSNPTVDDYITASCGPTNGINDYLDLAYTNNPPPFTTGSITSIKFAVGNASATCPDGYTQVPGDLNAGTNSKTSIFLCFSKDPAQGKAISTITAVTGEGVLTECPLGFEKIAQDLNEGVHPHNYYVYLCTTTLNYQNGIVDVEGIYFAFFPYAVSEPCRTGYSNPGVNFNNGNGGSADYVYMCFKEGNYTIVPDNTVRFPGLIYMRCNYTFNYINSINGVDYLIDSVTAVMADSIGSPKQGHIALTENDDEMMVIYVTGTDTTPSVIYGLSPSSLVITVEGTSSTYNASMLCGAPANNTAQDWFRNPGYIHHVLLTQLSYGTTYFYQFGNDIDGWSDVFSFTSRQPPSTRSVAFIAYADMGVTGSSSATTTAELVAQDVLSGQFDFLLHFGDIAYALGQSWIWDQFFWLVQPYATRIPYMFSIGNHEYDHTTGGQNDPSHAPGNGFHPYWGNIYGDSEGECAVPIYYRSSAPANGNDIFWYSFNYGPVHVIQMSSEHDWTQNSTQYLWIENDLKSVNRTATPWVILTSHRMMYTTQLREPADYVVSVNMRTQMEDLLYTYQVNAMLVGHQHSYERSCQVYQSKCRDDGTGTVHIIVGTAGAGLQVGGFSPALGEWSLVQLQQWGYNRVYATAETLNIQFVENISGTIFDEVTLYPWPSTASQE